MADENENLETTICEIDSIGNVTLTNNEVIQSNSYVGRKHFMQIFLKNISSVQLKYKSFPIWILLAVISLIVALSTFNNEQGCFTTSIVLMIIFIVVFFATRKYILIITARGGEKMVEIIDSCADAQNFVDKLVAAQGKMI